MGSVIQVQTSEPTEFDVDPAAHRLQEALREDVAMEKYDPIRQAVHKVVVSLRRYLVQDVITPIT